MTTRLSWLKGLLWLAALAAVAILLIYGGDLVVLVIIAAILAYLLFPLVNLMERRGMSRGMAAWSIFLGVLFAVGAVCWAMIPLMTKQVNAWQEGWEEGRFYTLLDGIEAELADRVPLLEPGSLGLSESVRAALEAQQGHLLGYATDALTMLGNFIVVPFVLFFLLRDGSKIMKWMVSLVPNRYFEFVMGVLYKIDAHLGGYLRGQSLIALLVGVATTVGLGLVGVDFFVVLGLFTGVANFIPYIGFIISAALTLVISVLASGGTSQILGIVLVFVAVQALENLLFQPWITARNVSLHPVSVLLAILIGGRIAGVLGMALAVPTLAVAKVIIVETAVTLRRFRL